MKEQEFKRKLCEMMAELDEKDPNYDAKSQQMFDDFYTLHPIFQTEPESDDEESESDYERSENDDDDDDEEESESDDEGSVNYYDGDDEEESESDNDDGNEEPEHHNNAEKTEREKINDINDIKTKSDNDNEKPEHDSNYFETNAFNTIKQLWKDEVFADVTLATVDNKQIRAHKVILSSNCSFFRNLLLNNPHQNPLIYQKDIKHSYRADCCVYVNIQQKSLI